MTLILCLIGSRGSSVLLSFISAPEPPEPQWSSFTPLPMNSTAKRLGRTGAALSANPESEPSHGRAMVTPAPRSTVRRVTPSAELFVRLRILSTTFAVASQHRRRFRSGRAPLLSELRTRDDRFHQHRETMAV